MNWVQICGAIMLVIIIGLFIGFMAVGKDE